VDVVYQLEECKQTVCECLLICCTCCRRKTRGVMPGYWTPYLVWVARKCKYCCLDDKKMLVLLSGQQENVSTVGRYIISRLDKDNKNVTKKCNLFSIKTLYVQWNPNNVKIYKYAVTANYSVYWINSYLKQVLELKRYNVTIHNEWISSIFCVATRKVKEQFLPIKSRNSISRQPQVILGICSDYELYLVH
jgi:hypothetical protein